MKYSAEVLGPCRVCMAPSYTADDEGPVHGCCAIHGDPCPACSAATAAANEQKRRRGARGR